MAETRIEIASTGEVFIVETTRNRVEHQNSILASLAESAVYPFRDPAWPADLHVGVGKDCNYVAGTVEKLSLDTYFAAAQDPGGEVFLTPVFFPDNYRGAVQARKEWTPPPSVKIWMAMSVAANPSDETPTMWLLFRHERSGSKVPFLPNIYDDSRVCTGRDQDRWHDDKPWENGLSAIFDWGKNLLRQAPWNADLLADWKKNYCRELIRYSADPAQPDLQLPFPDETVIASRFSNMQSPSARGINWLAEVVRR